MRKSLVMLVLLAMIATTFIGVVSSTSGRLDETVSVDGDGNLVDIEDSIQGLIDDPELEVEDDISTVGPQSALPVFRDEIYPVGPEEEGTAWPYNENEAEDPTRGAVNTSTLIYIQKAPKKVYFNDEIELEGLLLEDNNSDGQRNSGDLPVTNEFVYLQWAEGTEVYFDADLRTEWDNQEENMTAGRFSMPSKFLGNDTHPVILQANVTSIAANPIELRLYYNGVWTSNGADFFNLTQDIYDVLWDKEIGEDDDGDAPLLQNDHIDNDDDGENDSPDSFLDGSNGFPLDGTYQMGEDTAIDRSGGNWIDVNHGLMDYLDNDLDGEPLSPDSHHDGSNGYALDGVYQRGEDIGYNRYETNLMVLNNYLDIDLSSTRSIGARGFGSEIKYNWTTTIGSRFLDFGISDGATTAWIAIGVNGSTGSYIVPSHGDYSLVWTNSYVDDVFFDYTINIDTNWIDMDIGIIDGIDNNGNGMTDEFIDESIDESDGGLNGWPEGVDEDYFTFDSNGNRLDDDGDGLIDEDPNAFIARTGYEKRLYVEIWHKTKTTVEVIGSDLIDVGDTFTVKGTVEDTSYEYTNMGAKTMRLFWDGQPVAETVAVTTPTGYFSEYEFTYRVPDGATAGPHNVAVEFSPGFNITNNYYFDPSNATTTIHVRRPTKVIFDNIDPNYGVTWVYRGSTIWINGSIVDKLYFERDFVHEGPRLSIAGVEYGNQYRFNVMWGDPIQPFAKLWTGQFIIDDNGTFSIEYELPAGSQPLGPVTVLVETNFDESRYHDPLMYYGNSHNDTQFMVRARTELDIWIDQNKNGIDDENEQDQYGNPLTTFITRKEFKDANGKVYDWNYARVRGKLKDLSQSSGAIQVGVPNQEVIFFWGFGKAWQKRIPMITDANGNFEVDIPITPTHALGPVPIRSTFASDYYTNFYNSSAFADSDGQPFSVVSFTSLDVNASIAVKGKNVRITGSLLDDRGVGIGNRSVSIYRLDRWDGNYNSLTATGGIGTKIGTATTNSIGKFSFTEYIVEERMNVGSVWVVGKFAGSDEFPYGVGGIRYLPNDAFMPIISTPDKLIITSETAVVLESVPDYLVRNGEARITGKLLESYRGKYDQTRGVAGQTVTAYLKQGEEVFKMDATRTKSDPNLPEFNGYFEIKTQNVPSKLTVGNVEVIVDFEPEISAEGVLLYQPSSNRTMAEVWSSTRVKEVYFGPVDRSDPQDGRPDFYEDHPEDWVFTYQVLEGSTEVTSGDPVTYGVVWLNITMGAYTNTTRALTDIRGRVHFNFTSRFTDTATGNTFSIPAEEDQANLTLQLNFVGKQGYTSSIKTRYCTYHREQPPPDEVTRWAVLFLFLFILFLIACVILFFFYRYIERRRRLRSLKKIIKKAADQLETGNPYSAVIFKAYQKMGAHLRRYGFMRRDADTFREFEDAVRAALPIDERSLDSFLDILEEARYSKHVIGSGHKDRAIGCLRSVEKSLDNIILDEEAALRQMELADEDYVETDILVSDKGA